MAGSSFSGKVAGARRALGAYSAIVKRQETDVWAEDEYGKTIAEGEAGVDDEKVILCALEKFDCVYLFPESGFKAVISLESGKAIMSELVAGVHSDVDITKPTLYGGIKSEGVHHHIYVRDLSINGEYKNECIKFEGSFGSHHFSRLQNLILQRGTIGAYIQGANSSIISNIHVLDCGTGLVLTDMINSKLSNIEIWHATSDGVVFGFDGGQHCEGIDIVNIHILLGAGLKINNALDVGITNFTFDQLTKRCEILGGEDLFFTNGYISPTIPEKWYYGVGVYIDPQYSEINNVVFDNVTFTLSGYYGAWLNCTGSYNIRKVVFRNCRFEDNGFKVLVGGHVFLNNFKGTEEIIFEKCIFKTKKTYTVATYPALPNGTRVIFNECAFYETPTFGNFGSAEVIFNNCRNYRTYNYGTAAITADGTTTTFYIPHKLVATPKFVSITPKAGAPEPDKKDWDDINIILTFTTAPAAGTYYYAWEAKI